MERWREVLCAFTLSEDLFFLMSFESVQEMITSTPVINPFYAYTLNATFVRIQRCSNVFDIIVLYIKVKIL